jgi:hypothetical protein
MELDMSREQEEAELASEGLAPKKPVNGASAGAAEQTESVLAEAPQPAVDIAAATPAEIPAAPVAAAPAKKPGNPNRRALPPLGTGRRPGDEPAKKRRLGGLLRLVVEILAGGIIGGGIGYGAVRYFGIGPEQLKLYVGGAAGAGGLLFMFWGLLHYDRH